MTDPAPRYCPREHEERRPIVLQELGDGSRKCTGLIPSGRGITCGYREGRTGEQQAPVPNNSASMHDLVIADLRQEDSRCGAIERLEARKALGLSRYGTLLQAGNGRNWLEDLADEIADAVVYARQGVEETRPGTAEHYRARGLYNQVLRQLTTVMIVQQMNAAQDGWDEPPAGEPGYPATIVFTSNSSTPQGSPS